MKAQKKLNLQPKNIFMLMVAGIVNATGVILFLAPAKVLDGGISGLSLLISLMTPFSIAIFVVCLNLPFYFIGHRKLGWKFIIYSMIAIFSYALFSLIYQNVFKFDEEVYNLLRGDMFLCAIFGGLISGVGSGMTIRFGGAIDGIEVMAVLFAKKANLSVGKFVMIFNSVMYIIACFLLKDFQIGLYSIVTYMVGLRAVDFIVEGLDKGKACVIITKKGNEVAKSISEKMKRGITLLNAKGYYSSDAKAMLYCVVNRFEIGQIKQIINEVDSTAFVTISEVNEILGSQVKFSVKRKSNNTVVRKREVVVKKEAQVNVSEIPTEAQEIKQAIESVNKDIIE
jgi:uncharacterized membrane-anchored protein YitT (DUF2179 family)